MFGSIFAPKKIKLMEMNIEPGFKGCDVRVDFFKEMVIDELAKKACPISIKLTRHFVDDFSIKVYLNVKNLNVNMISVHNAVKSVWKSNQDNPAIFAIMQELYTSLNKVCFLEFKLEKSVEHILKGAKKNQVLDFAEHKGVVYFILNQNRQKNELCAYLSIVMSTIKDVNVYRKVMLFFLPIFGGMPNDQSKVVNLRILVDDIEVWPLLTLIMMNASKKRPNAIALQHNYLYYVVNDWGTGDMHLFCKEGSSSISQIDKEKMVNKFNEFLALEKMKST